MASIKSLDELKSMVSRWTMCIVLEFSLITITGRPGLAINKRTRKESSEKGDGSSNRIMCGSIFETSSSRPSKSTARHSCNLRLSAKSINKPATSCLNKESCLPARKQRFSNAMRLNQSIFLCLGYAVRTQVSIIRCGNLESKKDHLLDDPFEKGLTLEVNPFRSGKEVSLPVQRTLALP